MKKIFLITTCSLFFFGCNMNPSKEARIQELETELKLAVNQLNELQSKVQLIEVANEELKARIVELEK